jgi:ParB-like chromosome segregation protein Spo0J
MKKTSPDQGAGAGIAETNQHAVLTPPAPPKQHESKAIKLAKGVAAILVKGTWRDILPIHKAANNIPEADNDEKRKLAGDLKRHGLKVKIVLVRVGGGKFQLLDGRHRLDLLEGLGIKVVDTDGNVLVPCEIVDVADDAEAERLSISLNAQRRQLKKEKWRELLRAQIIATPEKSNRKIGEIIGTSHPTVAAERKKMEAKGDVERTFHVIDTDGRKQPRVRKKAVPKTNTASSSKEEKKEETGSTATTNSALPSTEIEAGAGSELDNLRADVVRLKRENIALLSEVEELQEAKTAASIDTYIIELAQQDKKVRALTLCQIVLRVGLSLSDLANVETETEPVARASS